MLTVFQDGICVTEVHLGYNVLGLILAERDREISEYENSYIEVYTHIFCLKQAAQNCAGNKISFLVFLFNFYDLSFYSILLLQ